MFTLELSETAGGKLKLTASEPSVGSTSKYSSSTGYTFYVLTARLLSVTWKGGEPVWEPSLSVALDKRTSSKEAAMREFRLRGGEGTAVFWRSPTGEYRMVARGSKVTPPE